MITHGFYNKGYARRLRRFFAFYGVLFYAMANTSSETRTCATCAFWQYTEIMGIGWHCVRNGKPICINRSQWQGKR